MLTAQVTQPGQQGKYVGHARTTNCQSLNSEGKSKHLVQGGPSSASKHQSDAVLPGLTLTYHPHTRRSAKSGHIVRNKWFKRCI